MTRAHPWSCLACLISALAFLPAVEAATIELGSNTVTRGVEIDVPLVADVGDTPLGRYKVFITYDTNLVQFVRFTNVDTNFGPVEVNTIIPGEIGACANNIGSMTAPTGVVQVAKITFQVVGRPGATARLSFRDAGLFRTTDAELVQTVAREGKITISASGGPP